MVKKKAANDYRYKCQTCKKEFVSMEDFERHEPKCKKPIRTVVSA